MSMCDTPLRELSNPGASGSIFYLTSDDEFIIKTVQHKEGEFLQKLLPGKNYIIFVSDDSSLLSKNLRNNAMFFRVLYESQSKSPNTVTEVFWSVLLSMQ